MRNTILFITALMSSICAHAVKLSAVTSDGDTYYVDLYGMTVSLDTNDARGFEIEGDTSDKFLLSLDGMYLSYSIYDDGNGHETFYFDVSDEPVYWRFDEKYGIIYSDCLYVDRHDGYIYYISLTYNAFHGYYIDIKQATYIPTNVARFSFVTESGGTGGSADNISDMDDSQGSVSFDILGRVCDGSVFGIRLSGNKSYINLKKEDK